MSLSSTSFDPWDPFDLFRSLSHSHPNYAAENSAFANTRIDWKETPKAHVFLADLPGLSKDEVKVEVVDGSVLQISGERRKEEEEKNKDEVIKWHCVERSGGEFLRRVRLPENADVERVTAKMENGVLTVTVAKEEKKKKKKKKVEIGGGGGGEEKKSVKGKKGVVTCCSFGV